MWSDRNELAQKDFGKFEGRSKANLNFSIGNHHSVFKSRQLRQFLPQPYPTNNHSSFGKDQDHPILSISSNDRHFRRPTKA